MKSILLLEVFVSSFALSFVSNAEDYSCWLEVPPQDDVWVVVYDADSGGNRGNVIWKGKIDAGREKKIATTDGHIRYQTIATEIDDAQSALQGTATIETLQDLQARWKPRQV